MKGASRLVELYRRDPVAFVKDFFGADPWGKQEEILRAVAQYKRVTVRSCHGAGKTKAAAWAVLWFLHCFPESIVVTTAPTWHQVENQLWREIRAEHAVARFPLGSRCLQTRLEVTPRWFAVGLSTDKPERFQGYHAEDILVVVDEAAGVREEIFAAVEGLLAAGNARLLLCGNPDNVGGAFYRSHQSPDYYKIHISCYDTPNFQGSVVRPYLITPEWVEEKRREWGEDSALFQIKCLGEFPASAVNSVIPLALVQRARTAIPASDERLPVVISVDVARYGDDRTVIYVMRGTSIVDAHVFSQNDTMFVAGMVHILAHKFSPDVVVVDAVGVGAGVVDRLREMGDEVLEFNGAEKASQETFSNLRAEAWWGAREMFQNGEVVLGHDDEELVQELTAPLYTIRNGRIQIEAKEDVKRRLGRSPDKADAYVMGLYALRHCRVLRAFTTRHFDLSALAALCGRYSGL